MPVNCAALTTTLAESQLFGHEKGAFTGALGGSLGVFRAAEGGIAFLDEIGEMPLELQPKLLRVLQQREVTPVGASHPVPISVQVIAATNRDLEAEVLAGRFREDLFYRLNMVELHVPPLRQRLDDIPELIEFFSARYAAKYNRPVWLPDPETLRDFCEFDWPGNIRQLSHVIEQAYVLESKPCLPNSSSARSCGRLAAVLQSGPAPRRSRSPGPRRHARPQGPRRQIAGRSSQHAHPADRSTRSAGRRFSRGQPAPRLSGRSSRLRPCRLLVIPARHVFP